MKTFSVIVLLLLTFSRDSIQAAQTANARIYCLSIRFNHARAGGPNAIYALDLTGLNSGINGELYPVFSGPRSHHTVLILTDELFDNQFFGSMNLNVPTTDTDGDGFPDIFDTSRAFSGASSGSYNFPGFPGSASGNATANWSRGANSEVGSCQLNFQNFGSFSHTFNILEYRGPLTYTPGSNAVTGTVDLALTGAPDSILAGPIAFTKSSTDPHNDLLLQTGVWTNSAAQDFPFVTNSVLRDPIWPTNYYGYFEFNDWELSNPERDYYLWVLSIDDLHDADSDGIPDFSDEPSASARRPFLGIRKTQTNLLLTISGNVGQICEVQEATTVTATNWPTTTSVTLTNDPQTISLPLPTSGVKFFRVRTP